jgi:hypothetical protein
MGFCYCFRLLINPILKNLKEPHECGLVIVNGKLKIEKYTIRIFLVPVLFDLFYTVSIFLYTNPFS